MATCVAYYFWRDRCSFYACPNNCNFICITFWSQFLLGTFLCRAQTFWDCSIHKSHIKQLFCCCCTADEQYQHTTYSRRRGGRCTYCLDRLSTSLDNGTRLRLEVWRLVWSNSTRSFAGCSRRSVASPEQTDIDRLLAGGRHLGDAMSPTRSTSAESPHHSSTSITKSLTTAICKLTLCINNSECSANFARGNEESLCY